jgi:apolipoprotein D and lipocalin family protein
MKKPTLGIIASCLAISACSQRLPMITVSHVDLDRFMGDWYVVANIPTFLERDAHNAVESYRMNSDGSIATTFRFRDGGFDGKLKEYHPTGFIEDKDTNARWGMRFIWPIKADYRIVYLDEDYSITVIAREARDYVWVMSRTPEISEDDFSDMKKFIGRIGYDSSLLQRVPQQWPELQNVITTKGNEK